MTISIIGSTNMVSAATGGVLISKMIGTGSNQLLASPAYILSQYIIEELATMTTPSDGSDWPLYVNHMPDGKDAIDNCGTLYDTTGTKDGRLMSGVVPQHFGIQLRIRSLGNQAGYVKIEDLAAAMDGVRSVEFTLDGEDYIIQNVSRTSSVIPLGIEGGTKRRYLFTINFLVSMRKV